MSYYTQIWAKVTKKKLNVNQKTLFIFSFLYLRYIRVTYSKYFQTSISEAAISSVTLKSSI